MSGHAASRIATLDIGTNTVLLLVAERGPSGLAPVLERATITRLGEGVDRSRELAPAARERTLRCLREYAVELERLGVGRVAAVGTSALRDARGGDEFCEQVRAVLGVAPTVIAGRREAELTFHGALSGLAVTGDVVVFDVGGGSTEIVRGPAGGAVASAVSLDVGSVRLFERHLGNDPATPEELELVRADVARALVDIDVPGDRATLVGVAGTVTSLAAIALELSDYDPARVHGHVLEASDVHALAERLARMTLAERHALPGLDPRRADVIVAGALIVEGVLDAIRSERLVVSDRGVRWGLAEELAKSSP